MMDKLSEELISYINQFNRESKLPFEKKDLFDYLNFFDIKYHYDYENHKLYSFLNRDKMDDSYVINELMKGHDNNLPSNDIDGVVMVLNISHIRFELEERFMSYNYHKKDCTPEEKNHARTFTLIFPPYDEEHPAQKVEWLIDPYE